MPLPERSKSIKQIKPLGDESDFDRTRKSIIYSHMRVNRIGVYLETMVVSSLFLTICPLQANVCVVRGHGYYNY
jgi:hypothetical protein